MDSFERMWNEIASLKTRLLLAEGMLGECQIERDEARAHTSTAAFMRVERQRDEARADFANACDVGRRQEARAEKAERERDEARAEVEMLRGVGCREAKEGEPEMAQCGVCLKCAEECGAKLALDSVGWSHEDDRWSIAERVCRDARERGEP